MSKKDRPQRVEDKSTKWRRRAKETLIFALVVVLFWGVFFDNWFRDAPSTVVAEEDVAIVTTVATTTTTTTSTTVVTEPVVTITSSTSTTSPPTTTTTEPVVYKDGAPGSCLILEEKYCSSGSGFLIGPGDKAIGFNLPKGTTLFFPWREGTFILISGSSSENSTRFPGVLLLDNQSNRLFGFIGFAPGDSLEGLEEDSKTLGIGDAEGDTLNLAMEVGSVLGVPLDGYGDGTYTLVVSISDWTTGTLSTDDYEQLFGVVEFSS